jgi:hypothetical protein
MRQHGVTLIQDTEEFKLLASAAVNFVIQRYPEVVYSPACFYTWMFAHLLEQVFGLSCEGHHRRAHPYREIVDRIRNYVDLDLIAKQTIMAPKIFDDQTINVDLWYDDLIIRFTPTPGSSRW